MKNIQKLLSSVRRPSRYIGGEWNSYSTPAVSAARRQKKPADVKAPAGASASICFCYPDLYEIGTSSAGLETLYTVVNEDTRFRADRCFAPDSDMASALNASGERLFSLELKKPLKDFDVVGFTLQHELCATNVAYMLDSAGIPLFSRERGDDCPLIVAGGPMTLNPEPLADFFDAVVIGDGEDAVVEIMERAASAKSSCSPRGELLKALAGLPGVYVPSFYEPVRDGNREYAGLRKLSDSAPDVVVKRVFDIAARPPVAAPVVPSAASVHARLSVEIARGCPHSCAFCQAAVYYAPLRHRSPEVVLEAVREGLKNTGYDEVSFSSLSSGDYPGVAGLIGEVLTRNRSYPLSAALPSLHCDKFDDAAAAALAKSASRPSVTLAPEAGTERLRKVIGKSLSDDSVVSACRAARGAGWKQVKLYFMYGLPTETDEDLEGAALLVKRIRSECRGLGLKISMSPFVPKPGTRLERADFCALDDLRRKKDKLRKLFGGAFKSHDVEASFVEALLARGGREIAAVVERAYRAGARFDQWREHFRFDIWLNAFAGENIEPGAYVNRAASADVLPWSHVSSRVPADFARPKVPAVAPSSPDVRAFPPVPAAKPVRFRIRLARSGLARFISHNDQIEIFRRAVRMARLPLGYSCGFHPQPKIAFGPAVSVGHESAAEYMEAEFTRYVPPQETAERISVALPDGYSVVSVRQIPTAFASLESLAKAVDYSVFFESPPCADPREMLEKFTAAPGAVVEIDGKRGELKKIVRSAEWRLGGLAMTVNILPSGNIKPEKIAAHIFGIPPETLLVRREKFYAVKKDGSIIEI